MLEHHLFKFLDNTICVENPWKTMDVLCFSNTGDVYYFNELKIDINLLFCISIEKIKDLIIAWAAKKYPLIDLDKYFCLPTNIVFAPYVPAFVTTPIIMGVDPIDDFIPKKSITSRYSTCEINPNNYMTTVIKGNG